MPKWSTYIPYPPRVTTDSTIPGISPKQTAFLILNEHEALYGGSAGGGKALSVIDTLVPTPDGFKKLDAIHAGDIVFGSDGKPCVVEWESETRPMSGYEITFDDGSTVVASDDHKWVTFNNKELARLTRQTPEWRAARRAKRKSRAKKDTQKGLLHQQTLIARNIANNPSKPRPSPTGTVRTTREIVDTLTVRGSRANHAIPVADELNLAPKDLPLDPYLLGAWLGDGTARRAEITTADSEVIEAFQEQYETSYEYTKGKGKATTYGILKLLKTLKSMNLIRNKHIPHDYLWGSTEQRLALLQGLLDTDGCVATSSIEFTNTNRNLTEGVAHLARSLGMKATVRERRATLYGKDCGPVWLVGFAADRIVFRIKRKAGAQSIASRRTTKFRYIKSVNRVVGVEMKCLKVSSPDSLFLVTEHLIPTHNSEALLLGSLQYVDDYPTSSLLLRRTYRDLDKPGGLMFRARQWLAGTKAHWDGINYRWIFPTGATLNFGYLEHEGDELKYQSSEYQYVGYDELTHFPEHQYLYLFSRLRRLKGTPVPLRMRGGTNPGGPGHEWVRKRWNLPAGPLPGSDRVFISADLYDNPFLEHEEYAEGLDRLGDVTKAQLLKGDWTATSTGGYFQAENFKIIGWDELPPASEFVAIIRYWDFAATEPSEMNPDPDYTVGLKLGLTKTGSKDPTLPDWYVLDVERFRGHPGTVENRVKATALRDGPRVVQWLEQERGAAGKLNFRNYAVNVLTESTARPLYAVGKKEEKARVAAARANEGRIFLVDGPWVGDFVAECAVFPMGSHDDQVDGLSNGIVSIDRERTFSSQGTVRRLGEAMKPVRRGRRKTGRQHYGY